MKKLIITILAGLPAFVFAQSAYTIKGKAGSIGAPAKVYLSYVVDKKPVVDSANIVNGNFAFAGAVKDLTPASLTLDYKGAGYMNLNRKVKQDVISIYLEQGTISLNSPDSLAKSTVTGTRTNLENAEYKAYMKPATDKMTMLMAEYNATPAETKKTKEFDDAFMPRYNAVQKEQSELTKSYIKSHPDSYLSLVNLNSVGGAYPEYAEMAPWFNALSERVRNTTTGKTYAGRLEKWKLVALGQMAPEFSQADTSGKMVSLSSFKGKYLLIDFWASWCGPCRAENPNVVKAYNKYKDKNFTILGVSLDQPGDKAKWLAAIHKDGLTWTHVSDLQYWNNAASTAYGVQAIPQNYLLDPTGKIIGKNLRGKDLEDKLAQIFDKI
ncbi:TlpA disulfide reductase family protein [Mucilaginibacter boryungensis]|uniref:AhpC/TSA family protein n=1 Tax=Mucilaginibacter boryungensis TaxID=768480 RepID=A0ABR9XC12_9SPHI|nr:TlpA disulfide reductase family protein [Mucilaginibacter boryungensis]MBE9664913.1 AhpC/TSA family protein [Mucilaginibacter boryungensis]